MLPSPQAQKPLLLTLSPLTANNRLILVTSDRAAGMRRATAIPAPQSAALFARRCSNTRLVGSATPVTRNEDALATAPLPQSPVIKPTAVTAQQGFAQQAAPLLPTATFMFNNASAGAGAALQHDNRQSQPDTAHHNASSTMQFSRDNSFACHLPLDSFESSADVSGVLPDNHVSAPVLAQLPQPQQMLQTEDFAQNQTPVTRPEPTLSQAVSLTAADTASHGLSFLGGGGEASDAAESLMRELESLSGACVPADDSDVKWEDCDLAAMSPCSLLDGFDSTPMEQLDSLVSDSLQLADDVIHSTTSDLDHSEISGIVDELTQSTQQQQQMSDLLPVTSYAPALCTCGEECALLVVAAWICQPAEYSVRFGSTEVQAQVVQNGVLACKTPG